MKGLWIFCILVVALICASLNASAQTTAPLFPGMIRLEIVCLNEEDTLNKNLVYITHRQPLKIGYNGDIVDVDTSKDSCWYLEFVSRHPLKKPERAGIFGGNVLVEFLDSGGELIYARSLAYGQLECVHSEKRGGWYFYAVPLDRIPVLAIQAASVIRITRT